jgi:hypothetical protein
LSFLSTGIVTAAGSSELLNVECNVDAMMGQNSGEIYLAATVQGKQPRGDRMQDEMVIDDFCEENAYLRQALLSKYGLP